MHDNLVSRMPISANVKIINDVALYADKEMTTEIVKSSSRILAEQIDHSATIYAFSAYTDSMVAQHVEQVSNWPGKELGAEVVPPPKPKEVKAPPQAVLAKERKEKGERAIEDIKRETKLKKISGLSAENSSKPNETLSSSAAAPSIKDNSLNKREKMAADHPMLATIMGKG